MRNQYIDTKNLIKTTENNILSTTAGANDAQ